MTDILRELDASGGTGLDLSPGCSVCEKAAKEVRRLRAALDTIKLRAGYIRWINHGEVEMQAEASHILQLIESL